MLCSSVPVADAFFILCHGLTSGSLHTGPAALSALYKALFQHGERYGVAGSTCLDKKTSVSRSEFLSVLMRQIWKDILVSYYGNKDCRCLRYHLHKLAVH